MEQPPPGPDPELIPNQGPKIDAKQLWLALSLPAGVTFLGVGLIFLFESIRIAQELVSIGGLLVLATFIYGWVTFTKCISRRYFGTSRVLLILAYPIIQAVLVFSIFFAGCLILLNKNGFY